MVSKVVLCDRRNSFARFSEVDFHFSWHVQHFGRVHVHFAWQAQHFRRVVLPWQTSFGPRPGVLLAWMVGAAMRSLISHLLCWSMCNIVSPCFSSMALFLPLGLTLNKFMYPSLQILSKPVIGGLLQWCRFGIVYGVDHISNQPNVSSGSGAGSLHRPLVAVVEAKFTMPCANSIFTNMQFPWTLVWRLTTCILALPWEFLPLSAWMLQF